VLAQLLQKYPEDVRIVYRHFPLLSIHNKAALATQASEAAGIQGKFWEMHDLLFERQTEWSSAELTVDQFAEWLVDRSDELGLDVEKFRTDMTSPELVALAQEAWDRGQQIGLPGTPFLLVNGQPYQGSIDLGSLSAVTEVSMMSDQQFTECPSMVIDPSKQYTATLQTEKGDIVIDLFADQTPITVNSFVFLAQQGWFDGVTFHRVLPGFVAQSGDPSGTGYGNPGFTYQNEIVPDLSFDRPGIVGMANSGADKNGSQFFIALNALEDLNGSFTIFGQVVEGLDVVESLTPRDPSKGFGLPPGDLILKVTIEEQ
jgi:cyclophilin family peptidyl-prolyl cis-trans isomerase